MPSTKSRLLVVTSVAVFLFGCSAFVASPKPKTRAERMMAVPIEGAPVRGTTRIYWDDFQVPFVEAEYDRDAAFGLGMVQAHLRLGILEMGRRVAQGRLSEIVGEPGYDVDVLVRTFDFDRAVPAIAAELPPDTREWIEGFVAGINHYIQNVEELPHEFELLGFEREEWSVEDILLMTRLGGSDVHWSLIEPLMKLRRREDFPQVWADLQRAGTEAHTIFDGAEMDDAEAALGDFRFAGSNCFAVSGERSETGRALLASDPHVGYLAPPIWLMAGVKCPSMHVVGFMPISMPFFALGRNPRIAWGGTNLYAASSSLYDVRGVDPARFTERVERIRVGSKEREFRVRDTPWGPIITDLPALQELDAPTAALRWVGHEPSDEITAMLAANRSSSFAEFRAAFKTYAISGSSGSRVGSRHPRSPAPEGVGLPG